MLMNKLLLIFACTSIAHANEYNAKLQKYLAQKIFGTTPKMNRDVHTKRDTYDADKFLNKIDNIENMEEFYEKFNRNTRDANTPYNIVRNFNGNINSINIRNFKTRNITRKFDHVKRNQNYQSRFSKHVSLQFTNTIDFDMSSIDRENEILINSELNLKLNLSKLIQHNKYNRLKPLLNTRMPLHKVIIKAYVYCRAYKNATLNKLIYFTNLTKQIKIETNKSQRHFFELLKQPTQLNFQLNKNLLKFSKNYSILEVQFKINLITNSHAYTLHNDSVELNGLLSDVPQLYIYLNDIRFLKSLQDQLNNKEDLNTNKCKRTSLEVDFTQLDLNVIRPISLNIHSCAGECSLPLDDETRASNHVVVQEALRNFGFNSNKHIPAPCCVPVKYTPVSFLVKDEKNNIIIRIVDDLIVDTCACR